MLCLEAGVMRFKHKAFFLNVASIKELFLAELFAMCITKVSYAWLIVLAPPELVDPPRNQTSIQGQDVVFNCTATAVPTHDVTWQLEDDTVIAFYNVNSTMLFVSDSSKYNLTTPDSEVYGQLTIVSVQLEDAREYRCLVRNDAGMQSAMATLQVQGMAAEKGCAFVFLSRGVCLDKILACEVVLMKCLPERSNICSFLLLVCKYV